MKIIERKQLETLKKVMGTPDIKVITGVRRSGKSMLLKLFEEYVAKEVKNANIISIDFNNIDYEFINEYHALNSYIENRYKEGSRNFVFIDEVQLCNGFEKTINSLHTSMKYDIYLTGSNAFLLSSDLATLFTGRTFTIEVYPFSFKEYLEYHEIKNGRYSKYDAFDKYLLEGGFSGSYIFDDLSEKYNYIKETYDTLIVRDVQQRNKIQNTLVLEKVSDFLINNISNSTTGRSVTNTLNNEALSTNHKTVGQYINYLCNAFAFYKVNRYDIKGKDYLRSQGKYYLCDTAIKYAKQGLRNIDYGRVYENIVAIELMRRGYEIYVGTIGNKEVDFIAQKRDEKIYIQVSYNIRDEKTFEREVSSLLAIKDAYPKILIANTMQPEQNYEGIHIVDIANWLSEE
ncbi:ATP-binding protein [bacterium]|nr:ATP-binding protein [bacterium]MBR1802352.1 ATP-binding protein [Candidatus Saccharibacteria bacterium]